MWQLLKSCRATAFIVLLCIACESGFAQNKNVDVWLNRINSAYVHSLDEFIQRFNAEEFHPDILYEDGESLRTRAILSLVDWHEFDVEDINVAQLLIDFADTVCWNDVHLNIEDSGIYAEAQCIFSYNHQEIPINIVLVFENIRDDYYKWAVAGATGLVECKLLDTGCNGYINPVQHELYFLELSTACNTDLSRFVSAHRFIDQLSFLEGLLKSGELRFIVCSKVRFYLMQVPGYAFIVNKSNRMDINSGYLVHSLIRMENSDKQNYIKQLLGIIER